MIPYDSPSSAISEPWLTMAPQLPGAASTQQLPKVTLEVVAPAEVRQLVDPMTGVEVWFALLFLLVLLQIILLLQ